MTKKASMTFYLQKKTFVSAYFQIKHLRLPNLIFLFNIVMKGRKVGKYLIVCCGQGTGTNIHTY